jgi:preprotein translocase subunit SecB
MQTHQQEIKPPFRLENIIVKNLSLEIPENIVAPSFGKDPTVQLEMRNTSRPLSQDNFAEVMLEGTVRVRSGEDLQLLIEVSQAGIFQLEPGEAEARQHLLNVRAPETLYPYFSQLISELMSKAGAPRMFLPPFDFNAVYQQKRALMAQEEAKAAAKSGKAGRAPKPASA